MKTDVQSPPPEIEAAGSSAPGSCEHQPAASDSDTAEELRTSMIDRCAIPIGICISIVAFLRFTAYSTRRLWFDEVNTTFVALQPNWADVWKAFAAAVDAQPPLFAYVTRISWLLLGRNELSLRVPEILGVIVFSWCMFFFVSRRLGPVFGLSAMILPMVTDLVLYAGEARPYGMLLAACGLALLAWRNAIENPRRAVALPLFAASLTLVTALHAFAVIAVLMFALTELIRYAWRRKSDWLLWACFLPVVAPLALYWFPFQASKSEGGVLGPNEWTQWTALPAFYVYYFHNRILLLLMVGLLAIGLTVLRKGPKRRATGMPWHETVMATALAAAPVFTVAVAVYVTKYYRPRYAVFAIAGLAILTVQLIDAVAPNRRIGSLALLFVSLGLFGLDQRYVQFSRVEMQKRDAELAVPFAAVPPDMPLVIASGLTMLPTEIYAPDAELARTYYLDDRASAVKYTGSTPFDWSRPSFNRYYHFRSHVMPYGTFVREHRKFWVFGPYDYCDDWQVKKLRDDGARIIEKGHYSGVYTDNFLLEVEMP